MSDETTGSEEGVITTAPAKLRKWILGVIGVIVVITQFFDETDILLTTAQNFWCKWIADCTVAEEYTEFVIDASAEMATPFLTLDEIAKTKWESLNEHFVATFKGYEHGTYAVRTYGGKPCNDSKITKIVVGFDHDDSSEKVKERISKIEPSGDADLLEALFKAIDDFGSDKDTVKCQIRVLASGNICNKEISNIERIKQKIADKGIDLRVQFIALAPDGAKLKELRVIADSLGVEKPLLPVYDPVMLQDALFDKVGEADILTKAKEHYDNEEELKALVYFEYLGGKNIEAVVHRADIHLNRNGDFYNDKRAMKLLRAGVEAGSNQAAYLLGMLYNEGGNSVEKDLKKAKKWLTKADELGHPDAKQIASRL